MKDSYLNLDEEMRYVENLWLVSHQDLSWTWVRFLNCEDGWKRPGRSILDVGVLEALKDSGFDHKAFIDRGGIYDWGRIPQDPIVEW